MAPLHADMFFICVPASLPVSSLQTICAWEKTPFLEKGRNFHISYFPNEMLEQVKCTQFHGSHIHMVTDYDT